MNKCNSPDLVTQAEVDSLLRGAPRQYGAVQVAGAPDEAEGRANTNNPISIKRVKGGRVRVETMLPPNILTALDAYAKKNGWSRSKALALAVTLLPGIEIDGKHEAIRKLESRNYLYLGSMAEGMSASFDTGRIPTILAPEFNE